MSLTTQLNILKRPAVQWLVSLIFSLSVAVITSAQTPVPAVSAPQSMRANSAVLLETLKAFSSGFQVHMTAGDAAAVPFYKQAIELDPNFASRPPTGGPWKDKPRPCPTG